VVVYAYSYAVGAFSGISGSGTVNTIPKFTATATIGDSILSESGYTLTQTSSNALSVYVIKGTGSTTGLWLYTNGANATLSNQDNGSLAFQTNGNDRLTVTSTGNVGIGTTSPATYSGYTTLAINNATNGAVLDFLSNGTRVASINNGGASFDIETKTATPMAFGTNNAERMRITSSGNVGIGTSSPTRLLDVNGVIRTQNAGSAGAPSIELGTSAQGNGLFYPTTNTIAISTNDTERMRITSAGLVGIGTVNSFLAQLNVGRISAGATTRALSLYNNSSNVADTGVAIEFYPNTGNDDRCAKISSVNTTTVNNADLRFFTSNDAAPAERMRITSVGNTQFSLPNSGNSVSPGNITLISTATAVNDRLTISFAQTGILARARAGIGSVAEESGGYAASLAFYTRTGIDGSALGTADERMRITSGGNLCLNTTSTDERFTLNGAIKSKGSLAGYFFEDRTNSTYWYGWYSTGNTNVFFFNGNSGTNIASISPSTGVYTALSDVNKKKDFEESTIGLNAILNLKPTLYRMKTDDESVEKTLGFIAQEVKEFIPQAYVESGEGEDVFIGLQDRPIIAALVKGMQEQQAQIEELKVIVATK
jgi:hypothetical protein